MAEALLPGVARHSSPRLFTGEAGPRAGILHHAVRGEGFLHAGLSSKRTITRPDDRPHRNTILAAELEVAFVVGGHGHDGAGAVAHQNEVADPDRNFFSAVRIPGVPSRKKPLLFDITGIAAGSSVQHG